MYDPHARSFAATLFPLPPKGAQFAPWGGPVARMDGCRVLKYV